MGLTRPPPADEADVGRGARTGVGEELPDDEAAAGRERVGHARERSTGTPSVVHSASMDRRLVLLSFAMTLTACGAGDGGGDAGAADAGAADAETADAAIPDGGSDAGMIDGPFGFTLRLPGTREVPCTGIFCNSPTQTAEDTDYICDLRWSGLEYYVYVQSHGTSFLDFMGLLYEVDGAWYSDGTNATPTTAVYLWGGNHHNDSLIVDLPSHQVRWDHSSFGFGFRQCQPMDCVAVYEAGPGAELVNGCQPERTVPAICKRVAPDGTITAWEDTFMRCAGDEG